MAPLDPLSEGIEPPVFDTQEPQGQDPQPPRATRDEMREMFQRAAAAVQRRADNDFYTAFGVASETDPTRFAAAREIAKTLNVDPDTALENIDVLKTLWAKRQASIEKLATRAPILARSFRDMEFARLAHEDVNALGFFEGLVAQWKAGHAEVQLARIGAERMRYEQDPPELLRQARNLRRDLRHAPTSGGFFWGLSRFGGQTEAMASEAVRVGLYTAAASGVAAAAAGPLAPVTVPAATLGGGVSGFTASMVTQMYTFEAGSSFDQLIQMGYDRNAARSASHTAGLVNMALESAGLALNVARPVLAPLKRALVRDVAEGLLHKTTGRAAWSTAKSMAFGVGAEATTEGIQQLVTILAEDWARKKTTNPDADPSTIQKGETWSQVVDAAVAGAQLASVLGAVPEYVHYRRMMDGAQRAQATKAFLEQGSESAKGTKVMKVAPDAATGHLQNVLQESGAETVFIDGNKFAEVLKQLDEEGAEQGKAELRHIEQLNRDLPDVAQQLAKAAADRTDVEMKTVDFFKLTDTDLGKKLIEHARVARDDPSFADVRDAREKTPELIKELEKLADDRKEFNDAADKFEAELAKSFADEVKRVGADVTDTQAQTAAVIARRMYESLANAQGKTVAEMKPLTVGPAVEGGESLGQFAGAKAKKADLGALADAERRVAAGEDPDAVRRSTGWHRGADEKWRFEIADNEATIPVVWPEGATWGQVFRSFTERRAQGRARFDELQGRTNSWDAKVRLRDVIDHPSLFENYPELALIEVKTGAGDAKGYFQAGKTVGESVIALAADAKAEDALSTLLHEIQHAIQAVENFGRGGNLASASLAAPERRAAAADAASAKHLATIKELVQRAQAKTYARLVEGWRPSIEEWYAFQYPAQHRAEPKPDKTYQSVYQHQVKVLADWLDGKAKPDALDQLAGMFHVYQNLLGETEARNTQARRTLGGVDRRLISPDTTKDADGDIVVLRQDESGVTRGSYSVQHNRITLDKATNATTLMHEIIHSVWNLAVAIPERSPEFQKDIDAMFAWIGVSEAEWHGMAPADRKKHQEKIARAGEIYFATGKAPTVELQGLFERIAKWFRDVYRDIVGKINAAYRQQFNEDLPVLTPEVRLFFDHLLAAEDAITEAETIRGRVATFETRESFPGTEEEWTEYRALVNARHEGGVAKLSAEMQKNLGWLQKSRDRVSKEVAAEARKLRKEASDEARADVENRGVFQLRSWMNTGKKEGEQVHKLRVGDIKSVFGVEAQDVLEALDGKVHEEGWPLDVLAERFGFETAEEMVRALLDEPTLADAVEARIDEIMLRDHGSLRSAEEQAMAIEEALNNEAASKLAYMTLRLAQKIKTPDRLTKAAVQEAARLRLENMPLRKIKARTFAVSAAKLEREAAGAFKGKKASTSKAGEARPAKAPNPQEAVQLLFQSVLNTEMARQALKIERKVAKELASTQRFFQGDKKLAKKFNLDWVNVGRAILAGFGMNGTRQTLPLKYMASLKEYDPLLHARLDGYVQRATGGNTVQDFRDLPLRDFLDLTDSLDMLWDRAERERQIAVEGKLVDKEEAKKLIAEVLAPRLTAGPDGPPIPLNNLTSEGSMWANQLAKLSKVEHTLRMLDGGVANGPMQKFFWTTLRKALDQYILERGKYLDVLTAEYKKLQKDGLLGTTSIDLREFLGPEAIFENTAHLLGAMINMGNESNLRNLLLGYEWGEMVGPEGEKTLDTKRWDDAMAHLAQKGTITKRHIDALQAIGKVNDALKVRAQAVNKEVYGAYFEEVEIKPIKTPWGDYDGWYAPSPVDPNHPKNALLALQTNDPNNPVISTTRNMVQTAPGVPHHWTITRTGGVRPRLLDLTKSAEHFDEMLRFIHLQIPLRDVWSLASDKDVFAMLEQAAPGFVMKVLKPMLDDTGLGSMSKPTSIGAVAGKVISTLTRNTSRMFMFGSLRNTLQQLTGIAAVVPYTSLGHTWGALRTFYTQGPSAARKFITEKSAFFEAREREHLATQTEELRQFLAPTWQGTVNKKLDTVSYFGLRLTQGHADMVSWLAGYNHWLESHPNDEAGAVTAADSVVRISQSSRTTMDTASIERGSPEVKMMTQFNHYWLNMLAQLRTADKFGKTLFWSAIVPTMAGAAIAAALSGGKEFEDGDDEFSETKFGWWLVSQPVRGGGSMFPVIGPVVTNLFTNTVKGGSGVSPFPAWAGIDALDRTVRDLALNIRYVFGDDDVEASVLRSSAGATKGSGIRALGTSISYLTGIPVKRVFDALGYIEDVADRRTERNPFSGLLGEAR